MFSNQSALIEPFNCNGINLGASWTEWQERLEQLFEANEVATSKGKQRLNTLFLLGGPELFRIHKTLPVAVPEPEDSEEKYTEYEKAIIRLDTYFKPQRNTIVERYTFAEAVQNNGETISQYVTRLRVLATYCDFADADSEIVGVVIRKCNSTALRRTFLKQKEIDIVRLLELGRVHDTLESHVEIVEGRKAANETDQIYYVNKQRTFKKHQTAKGASTEPERSTNENKCFNCGGVFPHPGGRTGCPAWNHVCVECHKTGHLAEFCRSRNKTKNYLINQIDSIESEPIEDRAYIFSIGTSEEIPTALLKLGNIELSFRIDTGAALNILDEAAFEKMKPRPELTTSVRQIFGYASTTPLPVIGKFTKSISSNGKVVEAEFHVVRGNHARLLSYKTCKDLNLIHIANIVCTQSKSEKETISDPKTANMIKEFATDLTNNVEATKDFELQLLTDKQVKPVQENPRNELVHLPRIIDEKIMKIDHGVVKIVIDEPTECLPDTLLELKERTSELHKCIDTRNASTAIIRQEQQIQSIESVLHSANGINRREYLYAISAFKHHKNMISFLKKWRGESRRGKNNFLDKSERNNCHQIPTASEFETTILPRRKTASGQGKRRKRRRSRRLLNILNKKGGRCSIQATEFY